MQPNTVIVGHSQGCKELRMIYVVLENENISKFSQ
jgi:hypothetical protein